MGGKKKKKTTAFRLFKLKYTQFPGRLLCICPRQQSNPRSGPTALSWPIPERVVSILFSCQVHNFAEEMAVTRPDGLKRVPRHRDEPRASSALRPNLTGDSLVGKPFIRTPGPHPNPHVTKCLLTSTQVSNSPLSRTQRGLHFGSGHDLGVWGSKPRVGVCANRTELAWDSLPISLPLPLLVHSQNKLTKKKKTLSSGSRLSQTWLTWPSDIISHLLTTLRPPFQISPAPLPA